MNRLIYLVTLCFISFCAYSQAQYAVVSGKNKYTPSPVIAGGKLVDICLFKNIASISDAIIKLKGDDWFINNILENESYPIKISYSIVWSIDTIAINQENRLKHNNMELNNVLSDVCKYLYSQHGKIFIYLSQFNSNKRINKNEYIKLIHNYIERLNEMQDDKNPVIYYIFNGFIGTIPGTTKFYYDKYYNKEIQQGNVPLSQIEWIKKQIDYYMNLHIESSLDYGIDNSAFMIN